MRGPKAAFTASCSAGTARKLTVSSTRRAHATPVLLRWIVRRQQEEQLHLERVRVLELVDEEVREAGLQLAADGGIVAHEVARAQQEVEEVEAAGARLERLVGCDHLPQRIAQPRGEVGLGVPHEGLEPRPQRI